ncbi:micronemal protein 4 [Cyclospora cayetanensis]|uniref:Micronemal protein 4 n=1 Tax=Cyclospora cayetanensis TaxID=88456 RepID=A0A6P6RU69_9EIME|nr:micronemal protein 4 [Cyclospora cayetanensis]
MRRSMRQVKELTVLAAMVVALSNQERTEAWNAAKHQDVEADQSFDAQSMIEAQWGTPYTHLPTIQAPDGSLVVVFETVSGEEKAYAVNVGPQNECAGMGTLVDNGKSEVLETLSSISSADDCQELCAQTRYCIGAIYDEYASTCSLMKSLRGLTRGLSTLVVPSCDSECFQKGKKFIEDGTSLGFAPNPNICQAMCEGEPTCRAFTWKDQQCVSYPNGALTAADANAVSGFRGSCSVSSKAANYAESCLVDIYTTDGVDFTMVRGSPSDGACNITCLSNSNCKWFTYNRIDKICFLKSSRGQRFYFSKRGDVTGPKHCDTSCFLKDIEYQGQRVATMNTDKISECHYQCSENSKCSRWTYESSKRGCYLFGETKSAVGARSKGFWSGPKDGCGAEPLYALAAPGCALRGVKYVAVPLQILSTSTATECQKRCQADSNCTTFAYNTTNLGKDNTEPAECRRWYDHLDASALFTNENKVLRSAARIRRGCVQGEAGIWVFGVQS